VQFVNAREVEGLLRVEEAEVTWEMDSEGEKGLKSLRDDE